MLDIALYDVMDAIINIELDKMAEPWRTAIRFSGMYHPRGQIFFGMQLPLLLQRRQEKALLEKIHSWRPDCILLCHRARKARRRG